MHIQILERKQPDLLQLHEHELLHINLYVIYHGIKDFV